MATKSSIKVVRRQGPRQPGNKSNQGNQLLEKFKEKQEKELKIKRVGERRGDKDRYERNKAK